MHSPFGRGECDELCGSWACCCSPQAPDFLHLDHRVYPDRPEAPERNDPAFCSVFHFGEGRTETQQLVRYVQRR